jgi:hypothetical protein
MGLDIRIPIGGLFSFFGVLLAIFGLLSKKTIYAVSLGININLAWGVFLTIFGAAFLLAGIRNETANQRRDRQ